MMEWFLKAYRWFMAEDCEHFWRPCVKGWSRHPAKVCDYCGEEVLLTTEQFYSQFGRMPF